MDPDKRQRLRTNHIFLKNNLQVLPVLDKLYAKGVILDDNYDAIRLKGVPSEQTQDLLDCLRRSGNNGYDVFCEALRELQPDLLKVIEETVLDKDITGQVSDTHIFFDPSEDFELKGLLDQLTIENKITKEQLERMKNFVIDEVGCPEEIIEKKDTSQKFLRHLMKTRLLTRYNLAFLQSLLWRVGNKALCREVANFARQSSQRPIHFYTPRDTAENGFSFSKFHIQGDLEHFKGMRIDEICQRVARYLGVPQSYVIPAGVEPSESLVLTIMLHNEALAVLKTVDNFTWLADLSVDYIMYEETRIMIEAEAENNQEISTELKLLEQELKRKMESEKHLKQCLYDEQVSNEILKDLQAEQEERLKRSEETVQELNIWYTRIFTVLLLALHFIAEFVKLRRGLLGQPVTVLEKAKSRFDTAVEKAKRWSSNHKSLLELVEATTVLRMTSERDDIDTLKFLSHISLLSVERNFTDAVTTRMTERQLGLDPLKTLDDFREAMISFELVIGTKRVEPMLQEILCYLANELDDGDRQRVCRAYSVPENLQTPNLKHRIFDYIIFAELDKLGKVTSTNEDIDRIMEAALKETKRTDLWDEFKTRNSYRIRLQEEQMKSQSRKQTDINERLDKIERMMQTMVGQNVMGSMGMKGRSYNGTHTDMTGIPDQLLDFFKSSKAQFPSPFQQQRA